jgi:hypothetical protein
VVRAKLQLGLTHVGHSCALYLHLLTIQFDNQILATIIIRSVSYVALSSNLIQTNLIERIKCDSSASYETN